MLNLRDVKYDYLQSDIEKRQSKTLNTLALEDSVAIDQISRLDTAFVQFIKQKSGKEITCNI